jgi:hypothetical protein
MFKVGGHTTLDDSFSANGDAIIFFDIPNGAVYHISDCTFIGYPRTPYQGGYAHNLSRAGIVFEKGLGTTPIYKATVANCYIENFSIAIHIENTAYGDIALTNLQGVGGWALIGVFGQFAQVRAVNCSWRPLVSGTYNGINGFAMADVGASNYTIDVYDSYYEPISANRIDGTYYGCTFDNFNKDAFSCGGSTTSFYNCTFNEVLGGPGVDFLFFGDTFQIFDNCTFNGANPGSNLDAKLSFETQVNKQLRIQNCVFNDCGLYVNGSTGDETIIDGCKFIYTSAIASLTIIGSGTQQIKIRNTDVFAFSTSSGTKLNNSASLSLVELSNSYIRNATVYTVFGQPFTMVNTTIQFDAAATPATEGFYGRFSDYVILSACTFISPTASAITLATPDLRNSCVTKINGTVASLANI